MLTSATEEPEKLWDVYRRAFEKVRAGPVEQLDVRQRDEVNDSAVCKRALERDAASS